MMMLKPNEDIGEVQIQDVRAIHTATVYQFVIRDIYLLSEVCGNPISLIEVS